MLMTELDLKISLMIWNFFPIQTLRITLQNVHYYNFGVLGHFEDKSDNTWSYFFLFI